MSRNANAAELCDIKSHLKDQGAILLTITAAALGAAVACAAILGLGWLIATNKTFKETPAIATSKPPPTERPKRLLFQAPINYAANSC